MGVLSGLAMGSAVLWVSCIFRLLIRKNLKVIGLKLNFKMRSGIMLDLHLVLELFFE
jgi:hypothetical protein